MADTGIFVTRPRIRNDVVFAETDGGVLFRHADDAFVLSGKTAYRVVSAVLPLLSGRHTVDELCEGLGEPQRAMVAGVVEALFARGFARDADPADWDVAPEGFATQIRFIEHYADQAVARFVRFRDAKVAVYGTSEIARAAARGLLHNGLSALDMVADAGNAQEYAAELDDTLGGSALVRAVDPMQMVVGDYDVIIVDGDEAGVETVVELGLALPAGTIVIPVVALGDKGVLGPAMRADGQPCWMCALLRLSANLDPLRTAESWRRLALARGPRQAREMSPPLARMLGSALAFDAFRLLTDCFPAESESAVLVMDLGTGEARRERLRTHPLCPECVDVEEITATPEFWEDAGDPRLPDKALFERYEHLVAEHAGILRSFDDDSLSQAPVKSGRVVLGPAKDLGRGSRKIIGFDAATVYGARNRAIEAAALAYVEAVGNRGLAHNATPRRLRERGCFFLPPHAITTWTGVPADENQPIGWRYARSLVTGRLVELPAASVHPSDQAGALIEPGGAGAGCGPTFSIAVRRGLHSALAHLALRTALTGVPAWELDPGRHDDPEITMLARAAGYLGHDLRLIGLPARGLSAVTLATVAGSPWWTVASSLTASAAAKAALVDLIGLLRLDGAPYDLGDRIMGDFDPRFLHTDRSEPQQPDLPGTDAELVRDLPQAGLDAFVVDTTPPDLRDVLSTVKVVLSR
ncbi:TOMM precursor leader peptide-binding protein [Nonomuraea sp. NPDC050404]|uniref:TOMM precursor leader peptide-binding protein n=1 Tax=Nonomuraea sp. NPDC050404 TaxID=3155783 RepID=UPI0033CE63D4